MHHTLAPAYKRHLNAARHQERPFAFMTMPSTGRRVIVSGASRGLGRAVAQAFAANGDRVAVHYGTREADARHTLDSLTGTGQANVFAPPGEPPHRRVHVPTTSTKPHRPCGPTTGGRGAGSHSPPPGEAVPAVGNGHRPGGPATGGRGGGVAGGGCPEVKRRNSREAR